MCSYGYNSTENAEITKESIKMRYIFISLFNIYPFSDAFSIAYHRYDQSLFNQD